MLNYFNRYKHFFHWLNKAPTKGTMISWKRIQFSSPFLFFGGPGMLSKISCEFFDFSTTSLFSLTAVCIRRTLDWLLRETIDIKKRTQVKLPSFAKESQTWMFINQSILTHRVNDVEYDNHVIKQTAPVINSNIVRLFLPHAQTGHSHANKNIQLKTYRFSHSLQEGRKKKTTKKNNSIR